MEFIKGLNYTEKKILNLIQKKCGLTKNQILEITDMKLTSLNRVINKLLGEGLILKSGIAESTGGRKPILYDINAKYRYIIGVNISRTYSNVIIVDLKMNIIANEKFSMTEKSTPKAVAAAISEIIDINLNEKVIKKDRVLGVGVGTVGPLDRENGIMLEANNFIASGWINVKIKTLLERELRLPILVDNGANTAVLGEALYGHGRDYRNIAYFNCGIGIRTGVIAGNTLIRTMNDTEDAFGHMVIDIDGELCSCGNRGCIECYASIPSIVMKYRKEASSKNSGTDSKSMEDISYLNICDLAVSGDTLSQRLVKDAGEKLGTGLANFSNLLNPDLIILSGPLVNYSDLFYETSREIFSRKTYFKRGKKVIFSKGGKFKDDSIALGAAAMYFEELLKSVYIK